MGPKITSANLLGALQEAIALHNGGRLDEADAIYRQVLRQAPKHPDALHLRALVCHAKGAFSEAAQLAEAAIAVAPRVANLHNTAGEAWRRLGRLDKAHKRLAEAVRLDPALVLAHHNLSLVCSAEGRHQEARQANERALALNPDYADAVIHSLHIACALSDGEAASRLAARVEKLADRSGARTALAVYHCRTAREHIRELRFAEGDQAAALAIAADPEFWGGWGLRGEALFQQLDFGQAELFHTIAVNLAPRNEDARRNLALVLKNQKRLDDAAAHLAAWLQERPDDAEAKFMLGTVALMQEDYGTGWKNYEARWDIAANRQRKFAGARQWDGRQVGSLLLYAEQGLGDTVQMLRFLPEVLSRCGGQVVLQVQEPLLRICRRIFGSDRVTVAAEIPPAKFDAACPLMSLPLALGANTPERIRATGTYLAAAPQRVDHFSELLSRHPGRKLGIVWQGSRDSQANRLRGLPEEALAPLLQLPGWTPVSLQFGVRNPEIASHRLVDLSAEIADFEDLAAAMGAVDAVISLDTGPAHLAGALGVPTHTLVPWLHDWRWGADGDRSPWYPEMVLFRQPLEGSWQSPVGRLAEKLGGQPAPDHAKEIRRDRAIVGNRYPFVRTAGRHGTFKLPLFDRGVTRSLLAYGEYSPREAELLASFLSAGDTAVEVGAQLGALTLVMARAVGPTGSNIALEHQTLLHQCLADTLAENGIVWVEARQQLAGSTPGKLRVARGDPTRAADFGVPDAAGQGGGEFVQVIRLDDLRLPACRLIRINARGRELEVLKGAGSLLAEHRPILFLAGGDAGMQEPLGAALEPFGYRLFAHESPLFSGENFRGCTADLHGGRVSRNLVGLPPGVTPPADLRPTA